MERLVKKHTVRDCYNVKGKVITAGFVHEFRNLGKIKFVILRDWTGIIQLVLKGEKFKDLDLNREDVIFIVGTTKAKGNAPNSVEIVVEELEVLSKVRKKLPVDTKDLVKSELETRLNYRFLDLRREKIKNIFLVKAELSKAFSDACIKRRFVEIHPTEIVGAATEGGADVFEVKYFEKKAFLAQSPQLYKQMAVIGGLEKVFMKTHVFRAEKHNTTTHLNEVLQMDIECAFIDDRKAMDYLEEIFLEMLRGANALEITRELNPDFEVPKEVKRYTYTEIVDLLKENNVEVKWGEDFSKEQEKKMFEILEEEAFIIHEWPTLSRAFYSMPKEGDEEICLAYDLMYKGLEIASGAQRIHIPEMLEEQLKKRGLSPKDFEFYLEAFRYGAPPHAGWSIGLERITMKALNLQNIREATLFPRDRTRITP